MKKFKTDIVLLQSLLVMIGGYYTFYLFLASREFISLFSSVSPVPPLAVVFLLFWTALGCFVARMRAMQQLRNRQLLLLILCPLLPLSAITGIIVSMIASIPASSHQLLSDCCMRCFPPWFSGLSAERS